MDFHFVFQDGSHISTSQRRQKNLCFHIVNAQFSNINFQLCNITTYFKVLIGKIGHVLDIEASNLVIKQPIKPLISFKVVNII